jgi:hypothetical protein
VATQQQVYFLFAKTAPTDAKAFINSYRPYLFTFGKAPLPILQQHG